MRKWSLALWFVSAPTFAAWTQVDADGLRTTFADPAGIERAGQIVRMPALVEFSRFQRMVEVGYFSQRFVHEYDCPARRSRRMSQLFHAGHMGEGSVIYADETEQEWEAVAPGTAAEKLLMKACS